MFCVPTMMLVHMRALVVEEVDIITDSAIQAASNNSNSTPPIPKVGFALSVTDTQLVASILLD